jgi:lipopolysaccharide export system protein LptA
VVANKAVVGGSVVLTEGPNSVRGNRLLIDMTTGEAVVQRDNDAAPVAERSGPAGAPAPSARPSAVFFPKQFKDKALKNVKPPGGSAASAWQSETKP